MGRSSEIQTIIRLPDTAGGCKTLSHRAAQIHAGCILAVIDGLRLTPEQKRKLLQGVIDAIEDNDRGRI